MNFEFRQRKIKPSIIALSICIGLVLGTVFVLLGGYNVLRCILTSFAARLAA